VSCCAASPAQSCNTATIVDSGASKARMHRRGSFSCCAAAPAQSLQHCNNRRLRCIQGKDAPERVCFLLCCGTSLAWCAPEGQTGVGKQQ
jgi:hypothetical protein